MPSAHKLMNWLSSLLPCVTVTIVSPTDQKRQVVGEVGLRLWSKYTFPCCISAWQECWDVHFGWALAPFACAARTPWAACWPLWSWGKAERKLFRGRLRGLNIGNLSMPMIAESITTWIHMERVILTTLVILAICIICSLTCLRTRGLESLMLNATFSSLQSEILTISSYFGKLQLWNFLLIHSICSSESG